MIDKELIKKYEKALPRYTSYPPATSFHSGFTADDYVNCIKESNKKQPQSISVYIHIPFCPRLCLYCGCTTHITRKQDLIESYLEALKKEIRMVASHINLSRPVTQIHWGGGTPNALSEKQIGEIMQLISSIFKIDPACETAIECNPAHLSLAYLDALFGMGFNRISLGIQDFDHKVLRAAHRELPAAPIEVLTEYIRSRNVGVNFDFIYGLPHQTVESFSATIRKALELKPDRLVTFSYAHVPWVKPHQSALEKEGLPGAGDKLGMFDAAYAIMMSSGEYDAIGLDHFSRKDDSLSIALRDGKLHRNFQGYCTRETTGQVYAFGMSAISQLYNCYAQNVKNVDEYISLINAGRYATEKGYILSREEMIIGEVISNLMCNDRLEWAEVAAHFDCTADNIKEVTGFSPGRMKDFVEDGLLEISEAGLKVTEPGRFIIRNIAAELDPNIIKGKKQFSKSI